MARTRTPRRLSTSTITSFKACPYRFRLAYVEGLRPDEDTDIQRIGTNWHKCQEVAAATVSTSIPPEDDKLEKVAEYLDQCYAVPPASKTTLEWATERAILAYSMAGYLWMYQNDPIESIAQELSFRLPLRNPVSGRALPKAFLTGRIDRLLKRREQPMTGEYKSTSRPIDTGSTYWPRLRLDGQISMYDLAAKIMQRGGRLAEFGLTPTDPLVAGTLYDVWHRPLTRPKLLTQAATRAFLTAGEAYGEHCGQAFVVQIGPDDPDHPELGPRVAVDGEDTEVKMGAPPKKAGGYHPFAIRETPDMFGARLLMEIQEQPDQHFARREIARTDKELEDFGHELMHVYQSIRAMEASGHWFRNEGQCEAQASFKCPYLPICYHGLDVCDGHTCPDGFKRVHDEHSFKEIPDGNTVPDTTTASPETAASVGHPENEEAHIAAAHSKDDSGEDLQGSAVDE